MDLYTPPLILIKGFGLKGGQRQGSIEMFLYYCMFILNVFPTKCKKFKDERYLILNSKQPVFYENFAVEYAGLNAR